MNELMMKMFEKLVHAGKILIHNVILHPIAGLCWAAGFPELAFRVHDLVLPPE